MPAATWGAASSCDAGRHSGGGFFFCAVSLEDDTWEPSNRLPMADLCAFTRRNGIKGTPTAKTSNSLESDSDEETEGEPIPGGHNRVGSDEEDAQEE